MEAMNNTPLSPKELDVLRYLAHGKTAKQIAEVKGNSPSTIQNHMKNIRYKLEAKTIAGAVATAIRRGII